MKKITVVASVFLAMFIFGGCQSDQYRRQLEDRLSQLEQTNSLLQKQIAQLASEKDQLQQRLDVLLNLDKRLTLEDIYDLRSIRIGKYTGFYDKNGDGKKEKLIVYVQPVSADGEVVRAIGDVEVQLWDLERTSDAMLKQWKVGSAELKDNWYSMLVTNYRLTFDVENIAADQARSDLTVRVIFTDHLSGKIFKEQAVVSAH